jgi:hypothetical protein
MLILLQMWPPFQLPILSFQLQSFARSRSSVFFRNAVAEFTVAGTDSGWLCISDTTDLENWNGATYAKSTEC